MIHIMSHQLKYSFSFPVLSINGSKIPMYIEKIKFLIEFLGLTIFSKLLKVRNTQCRDFLVEGIYILLLTGTSIPLIILSTQLQFMLCLYAWKHSSVGTALESEGQLSHWLFSFGATLDFPLKLMLGFCLC